MKSIGVEMVGVGLVVGVECEQFLKLCHMIFPFISSTIINIVNIHLLQSCGALNANHIWMVLIFYLHCAPLFISLLCLCVLLRSVQQYVGHICMLFMFCETQQLMTCSFNVTIICET
jgi:hypothetical protein